MLPAAGHPGPSRARHRCAPSALAAAVRRRAAGARRLQPAGLCARARGVCVRALVACVLTKVCPLDPLPGCTLYLEQSARAWSWVSVARPRGRRERVQVPLLRASGLASFLARGAESALGRGGRGQLGTRVAQLKGRFRALCAFWNTLVGSAPRAAAGTQRTRESGMGALQPRGAAEPVLSFPTRVCKSELENSRRAQPPPSSPAPQSWPGWGWGEFPWAH